MTDELPPQYPGVDLSVALSPGFPSIHEAYRTLRDQKDMVCGAYALTYLLQAYGVREHDSNPLTVDHVAALAGTGLEEHNSARQELVEQRIENSEIPPERAAEWHLHEYFTEPLETVAEGGTSPCGLVRACHRASDGLVTAVPVPATIDGDVQLTRAIFGELLERIVSGSLPGQLICNYNLRHTLAPASLLGHKYSLVALLTQWDDSEYFRRLDWDVGHFTSVAGRIERDGSGEQYLLIRDSYKSFGWDGYHLQPESAIHTGIVRANDSRDGGVILVVPTADLEAVETGLADLGLEEGVWDNGSEYTPVYDDSTGPTDDSTGVERL